MGIYLKDAQGNRYQVAGLGLPGASSTVNGMSEVTIEGGDNVEVTTNTAAKKIIISATGGGSGTTIVPIPQQQGTLTYTGQEQTPVWANANLSKCSVAGDVSSTDAGTYTAVFTLSSTNDLWSDMTNTPKNVTWTINKASATIPTTDSILVYNSNEQSPVWNGLIAGSCIKGGDLSGTNAGDYATSFTLTPNYKWSDDTTGVKNVPWSIARAAIGVPTLSGSYTYTGSVITPTFNGYDSTKMTISGDTSKTNAGNYSASFTPEANYKWTDGSITSKSVSWTINRASTAVPTAPVSNPQYTGNPITPTFPGYDSNKMSATGISGTVVGSYTAKFTVNSNYQWTDGTTVEKSVPWQIIKANGSLALNKTSMNLTTVAPTGTIEVTRSGTGAIAATSSDSSVAEVSVNGTTVTVTGKKEGNVTITVSVAADSNYNAPANATCSVTSTVIANRIIGVSWNYGNSSPDLQRLNTSNNSIVNHNITSEPVPAVGNGAGSSPFDNIYPWNKVDEWNVVNETVTAKRGQPGFSRTANDTVVFLPIFYYKIDRDSTNSKTDYYISQKPASGFSKHPGSGRCIGKYNTGAGYVSKSGMAPLVNITRGAARTGHKGRGAKFNNYDLASFCALQLLYLVEYASWDSQSKVGRGYVDGNSASINTGSCDAMTYHTGRPAGTDGKTGVMYRWVENPWGNVFDWVDGANFSERKCYICTNPDNFTDDTTTNYTDSGVTLPSSGWIKGYGYSNNNPWAFIPDTNGGSETIYACDYVYSKTGWRVLGVGGSWDFAGNAGLFYFNAYDTSSYSYSGFGARQLYSPTEAEINLMAA